MLGEIRNTQSQLKDVEKLLKLDLGNTELLAQKHKLLGQAAEETKDKLTTLKTAAEQANTALANGEISQEQYDALQREIITGRAGKPVCHGCAEDCRNGRKTKNHRRQYRQCRTETAPGDSGSYRTWNGGAGFTDQSHFTRYF